MFGFGKKKSTKEQLVERIEKRKNTLQKLGQKYVDLVTKNENDKLALKNDFLKSLQKMADDLRPKMFNAAGVAIPSDAKTVSIQPEAAPINIPDFDLKLDERIESVKQKAKASTGPKTKTTIVIEQPRKKTLATSLENLGKKLYAKITGKKVEIKMEPLEVAALDRYKKFSKFDFRRVTQDKKDTTIGGLGQISVKMHKKSGNVVVDAVNALNEWMIDMSSIPLQELVNFYQLLDVMINAGVPLIRSLNQLVAQTDNLRLKKILAQIVYEIENGSSLSAGMDNFPDVFDDAQRGMVRAGEASGRLGEILRKIADSMEKTAKITSKIKGAMIYPVTVVVILVIVGIVVMVMIIPKLKELFLGAGIDLPLSTRVLIVVSDFILNYAFYIVAVVVAVIMLIRSYIQSSSGRFYWDYIKLHVPIFGKLTKKVCLSRFSRALGTLSASGLSIIKALEINADAVGNEIFRREILLTAENVKRGVSIADDLKTSTIFPTMVVNMIAVGEETAKIDHVSIKIAEYYDAEIDNMVKNMSSIMEPVIIVVIGGAVALLVAAVMQPIMRISEVAEKQ